MWEYWAVAVLIVILLAWLWSSGPRVNHFTSACAEKCQGGYATGIAYCRVKYPFLKFVSQKCAAKCNSSAATSPDFNLDGCLKNCQPVAKNQGTPVFTPGFAGCNLNSLQCMAKCQEGSGSS